VKGLTLPEGKNQEGEKAQSVLSMEGSPVMHIEHESRKSEN